LPQGGCTKIDGGIGRQVSGVRNHADKHVLSVRAFNVAHELQAGRKEA
jgi:hypothetical protein